jgi:hypothetical protein
MDELSIHLWRPFFWLRKKQRFEDQAEANSQLTKEGTMSRNKVSFLFPLLSLLLFLVLSFLRCTSTDVARNPMMPSGGDSEELVFSSTESPVWFDDDLILKTKPQKLLHSGDVNINNEGTNNEGGEDLWVNIADPKLFVFDFGPEGTTFKKPVKIIVSLDKADFRDTLHKKLKVWYLSGDRPKRIPSVTDFKDGTLTFRVKHFSRYALTRE